MENWQLVVVVLASVFVGALIPLIIMMALALHRAAKAIAEIGVRLNRTLTQVEVISDRVEVLSRGLKGGEASIADLLTSVGHLANGFERNMKVINISSAVIASVGTAVAAYVKTRFSAQESGEPPAPDVGEVPDDRSPPPPSTASPGATLHAQ
jgi:hypothetical protein